MQYACVNPAHVGHHPARLLTLGSPRQWVTGHTSPHTVIKTEIYLIEAWKDIFRKLWFSFDGNLNCKIFTMGGGGRFSHVNQNLKMFSEGGGGCTPWPLSPASCYLAPSFFFQHQTKGETNRKYLFAITDEQKYKFHLNLVADSFYQLIFRPETNV